MSVVQAKDIPGGIKTALPACKGVSYRRAASKVGLKAGGCHSMVTPLGGT